MLEGFFFFCPDDPHSQYFGFAYTGDEWMAGQKDTEAAAGGPALSPLSQVKRPSCRAGEQRDAAGGRPQEAFSRAKTKFPDMEQMPTNQ